MSGEFVEGDQVDFHSVRETVYVRRGTVTGVWMTPGGHVRYGVQWDAIDASEGLSGYPGFYGTYRTDQLDKAAE